MAETDNSLLDLHNSSYDTKVEFNNWVFECVHPFIDAMFITEPAVPSAFILGLGSKLHPSNMQCMLNKDLT